MYNNIHFEILFKGSNKYYSSTHNFCWLVGWMLIQCKKFSIYLSSIKFSSV